MSRAFESENLTRPSVELLFDPAGLFFSDGREVQAARPRSSGPGRWRSYYFPLPSRIRVGKVDIGLQGRAQAQVLGKILAVVGSQGMHTQEQVTSSPDEDPPHIFLGGFHPENGPATALGSDVQSSCRSPVAQPRVLLHYQRTLTPPAPIAGVGLGHRTGLADDVCGGATAGT